MFSPSQFFYPDPQGNPLPGGTAIEDSTSPVQHQGLIAWRFGCQVVLENSFRHRGAVEISAFNFNGGKPVQVVRSPQNYFEAEMIVQRAWADVQNGVKWSPFYNCQDFISHAYTGRNGSKTRDGIVLGGLAAALLFALAA